MIVIAQKECSDQNDCMETVRSAIAMIAIATIVEIENVLSQRSLRSLSARFPYNRSDLGVFLSYRSDPSDYMHARNLAVHYRRRYNVETTSVSHVNKVTSRQRQFK